LLNLLKHCLVKKETKRKIVLGLKMLLMLVLLVLFTALVIYARKQEQNIICHEIDVHIKNGNEWKFLNEQDILAFINNNGQNIVINQALKDISMRDIEQRIENSQYVEKADVYANLEGKVRVDVFQKIPVYRVFNTAGVSYYVSENGESIPISSKFTPRLIVATGNLSSQGVESIHSDLLSIVRYIQGDDFWEALIGQIEVEENGDFILYPKIDEHRINLGNTERLEEKFRLLQIFYQEALKNVNWKLYKEINLKFKGQIICIKN